MMPKLQRDALLGELAALEKLVAELTAEDVAVRLNLHDRIDELQSKLEEPWLQHPEKWAHAGLFFGGAPVHGKKGIDADFASHAIGTFQDIVSATSATKRRGPINPTGPIPDKKTSRLHITGVLRGSFGFELTELDSRQGGDPLFGRTPLAEDLEDAAGIVSAASESDEAFVDAVADGGTRVVSAVGAFFKLLRQRGATFRMVSGSFDRSFNQEAIAIAADRADMTVTEEQDVPVQGVFGGAFPASRRFEMTKENGELVYGSISRDINETEIMTINRSWSGLPCLIHMKVIRVTRAGATPHLRYTLLSIESAPQAESLKT